MKKYLSKIHIHVNDLSVAELYNFPKKLTTLNQIIRYIMLHGATCINGDTCVFIPPQSITKMVFTQEEAKNETEEQEDDRDDGDSDDC